MDTTLYRDFNAWRVKLYEAMATRQVSDEMLHCIAGDLRQTIERLEQHERGNEVVAQDEALTLPKIAVAACAEAGLNIAVMNGSEIDVSNSLADCTLIQRGESFEFRRGRAAELDNTVHVGKPKRGKK